MDPLPAARVKAARLWRDGDVIERRSAKRAVQNATRGETDENIRSHGDRYRADSFVLELMVTMQYSKSIRELSVRLDVYRLPRSQSSKPSLMKLLD